MGTRLELHALLKTIPGVVKVYFQEPEDIVMVYPCIVYQRDPSKTEYADNAPYLNKKQYSVTVIDRDPDSNIPDEIAKLPLSSDNRFFTADKLNHFVYNLFF